MALTYALLAWQVTSAIDEGLLRVVAVELARFKPTQVKAPATNAQKAGTIPILQKLQGV